MIVTAPTGVAAINAGGVTLHSFFQMPLGPFVPGSEVYDRGNQRKFSREKINIIRSLDLLVIDEISMVRADLLDGVDAVLRRYRRNDSPFGGVQLLMIGDLGQLPPVVTAAERDILRDHYDSAYFFSSHALLLTELVSIELKHVYRQSDLRFIELLNRVRDHTLDPATLRELNSRYIPGFVPREDEDYITLCTHNRGADTINQSKLRILQKKAYRFRAEVQGEFPEYMYPTSALLELKKGAQVMFVRNDPSGERLYYNGKIGKVTRIMDGTIHVKCPGDGGEIAVEQAVWENIRYAMAPGTKEIMENKVGEFVQYPLKLAWAITIHKSQGLTFERAVIDAQAAFAHGQVYVALSRCKTFEGMVFSSPISSHAMKADDTVRQFAEQSSRNPPSSEEILAAKIGYQQRLLHECFDFQGVRFRLGRLVRLLLENVRLVRVSGVDDLRALERRCVEEVCVIGENFKKQMAGIFSDCGVPESDGTVLERIGKASVYFAEKIDAIFGDCIQKIGIETDNKEIRKSANEALDELKKEIAVKSAGVKSCRTGFSPARYLRAISAAEIDFESGKAGRVDRKAEYAAGDVGHPEMFQALRDWRARKAAEAQVPHYRILHQSVLIQIAGTLPDDLIDLRKIKGVGKRLAEKYGEELLALVSDFRRKHNVAEKPLPDPTPEPAEAKEEKEEKRPVSETRQTTLDMFQTGLTIAEIAEERGLVTSTIQGHLAFFVGAGKLEIGKLLSFEKQQAIEQKIEEMEGDSLGAIKRALGDDYSYGDIRIVQAHRNYLEQEGKTEKQKNRDVRK